MNWKTTATLLGLLLGLGGLAAWDEWQSKRDEKDKESKTKIASLDKPAVTEIEFESIVSENDSTPSGTKSGDKVVVKLERKGERWWVTAPINAQADDSVVNSLLQTIDEFKSEEEISGDPAKRKEYGLEQPTRMIKIRQPGKSPEYFTLMVGGKVPVGYSVYVATSLSDRTYMGNQYVLTATNKSLKDFRDKTVVSMDPKSISQVTYRQGADPEIVLSAAAEDWKVDKPVSQLADKDHMNSFLGDIASLKADDFLDQPSKEKQKAFLTQKDLITISWKKTTGDETSIRFAEVDKSFWASLAVDQIWFRIPEAQKGKLKKKASDFRNRKIFDLKASQIESVNVDGELYKKIGEKWYLSKDVPEGKSPTTELEKSFLSSFVSDLEYLKADGFTDVNSPEGKNLLKNPPKHNLQLSLGGDATQKQMTLDIWEDGKEKNKCQLRPKNHSEFYKVNCSVFVNLKPPAPVEEKKPSLE